jgi:hypothetical protein
MLLSHAAGGLKVVVITPPSSDPQPRGQPIETSQLAREGANQPRMGRELGNERFPSPQLELALVPGGGEHAAKERPAARTPVIGMQDPRPLPDPGRHDRLGKVAPRYVRSKDNRAHGAGFRSQHDKFRWIARMEVPYLVGLKAVEGGKFCPRDEEEDGRTERAATRPALRACPDAGEIPPLHGERIHPQPRNYLASLGVHSQ